MSQAASAPLGQRVWGELQRSLAETFSIFRVQENGVSIDYDLLLTRVIVAAITLLLFWLLTWALLRLVGVLEQRFRFPAKVARPLRLGLRYLLALIAGLVVLRQFGLSAETLRDIGVGAVLAFGFYLVWIFGSWLTTRALEYAEADRSLEQLARNVLAVLISVFALVTVLNQFGIQLLSIVATLGVAGIAVGFAAQDTLSNFIAGITLLIERPFRIGDWIILGDRVGRVEAISLRTTRITTRDNASIVVPNAQIAAHDITNLSAGGPLRITIPIGIAYKESAARAREVMLPILSAHPKVLKLPGREPQVWLKELGDSSVNLALLYWIAPEDIAVQPAVSAALLEACKVVLDEAGIEIPFPHLQLFIDDAKGLEPVLAPLYPSRSSAA